MLFRVGTNCVAKLLEVQQKSWTMQKMQLNNTISGVKSTTWTPENYLTASRLKEELYAVMILNRPINLDEEFVVELWNSAQIRHTVDGGTDRWMQFVKSQSTKREILNPDIVTGDFDSVNPETLQHMESLNCDIVRTPDQDETDFTKALRQLVPRLMMREVSTVIVLAETSGRIDQIMGNINTLFKAQAFASRIRIFILSSNSLSWLLSPGHHCIDIPPETLRQRLWCALIPVGRKCVLTTKGLKWDMTQQTINFGALVSTSNTYNGAPMVEISSSDQVLWSMGTVRD
ncbi:thiamin pyrophosphokinase 1 [Phlebotomus argentipes]|uniref:thiamin pyrophosphokinase 1 n=1 Tax=Phlebotomus argentipes TaxID=94469 RepID=UPI0028931189|nr:thiamin pyrophosphokinase 1 [Phlebotomus argentipes]